MQYLEPKIPCSPSSGWILNPPSGGTATQALANATQASDAKPTNPKWADKKNSVYNRTTG